MEKPDCIFCQIAAHRAPAAIVYEDESSLAFLDIHPMARGHTLVIPREHFTDIFDLSQAAGAAVIRSVQRVARAIRGGVQPDGLQLLQGNGRAAAQTVFHFHIHLVPRWHGDQLFHILPARPTLDVSGLEPLAAAIRQNL